VRNIFEKIANDATDGANASFVKMPQKKSVVVGRTAADPRVGGGHDTSYPPESARTSSTRSEISRSKNDGRQVESQVCGIVIYSGFHSKKI